MRKAIRRKRTGDNGRANRRRIRRSSPGDVAERAISLFRLFVRDDNADASYPGRHAPRPRSLRRRGGRFGRKSHECYTLHPHPRTLRTKPRYIFRNRSRFRGARRIALFRPGDNTTIVVSLALRPVRPVKVSDFRRFQTRRAGGRGGAFRGISSETKLAKPRRAGAFPERRR